MKSWFHSVAQAVSGCPGLEGTDALGVGVGIGLGSGVVWVWAGSNHRIEKTTQLCASRASRCCAAACAVLIKLQASWRMRINQQAGQLVPPWCPLRPGGARLAGSLGGGVEALLTHGQQLRGQSGLKGERRRGIDCVQANTPLPGMKLFGKIL